MRLMECLRLRVQEIDFGRRQILVRSGKGNKDGGGADTCADSRA